MHFVTKTIDGQVTSKNPNMNLGEAVEIEAAKFRRAKTTVEDWSEGKELSDGQRKWWKGILLPALADFTGDSIAYWENKIKLNVMPDKFAPVKVATEEGEYYIVPSIKILTMHEMNIMVEGSVDYLRDEGQWRKEKVEDTYFKGEFHWVTLPDALKKKKKD